MAKKWPGKVVQRSFIKGIRFQTVFIKKSMTTLNPWLTQILFIQISLKRLSMSLIAEFQTLKTAYLLEGDVK